MNHPLGLCEMQAVSVGLSNPNSLSDTLSAIRDAGLVKIHRSVAPELVIEFTAERGIQRSVAALGLSLIGRPDSAA
jgi:hypothetical protein